MTRDMKRARDRHAASVRSWQERLRREALAGERKRNSIPRTNPKRRAKFTPGTSGRSGIGSWSSRAR